MASVVQRAISVAAIGINKRLFGSPRLDQDVVVVDLPLADQIGLLELPEPG